MTTFREMHKPGNPFILANAWDAGSAKILKALGAQAIATSSAAHAFTLGRPDGLGVSRDEALSHAIDLIAATGLPVQGDFENGWGDDPDTVAETVTLAGKAGLAGICIEDIKLPSPEAYDRMFAIERIKAAVAAARALPHDFVLTARADGIMTGAYDIDEAIARLQGFEAVGADCLYAPLPKSTADVARICASVTAPVNVLVAGPIYAAETMESFARMGAARLSLGSALARATHRTLHDAATQMFAAGSFANLGHSISGDTIDALLD
ncbi:isocitrate lyase/phosphoenolpyruvate mutase family protein [Octadecabacter sp. G9-8]|uniref:Isocitrate lyase/phosphoenolpyruvate mutase family protein n=1 Tax=Octadecabacter dasysiphoniae TaxID=2909341 RepID=A0ABS9D1D1_9RHOB|nr:isocitrate lyase/phosphoenolpyruvate mutase family protein [Octadecabacter dasysiphoniae]MCF2872842.1 isocitrate lyase/phosphoenolpyruvate mutase family protein [Octadecabacter dasysiphoniae]